MIPWNLICGDAREKLKLFPDNFFHSCVMDGPYGFRMMGAVWDTFDIEKNGAARDSYQPGELRLANGRTTTGFGNSIEAGKYNQSLSANKNFQKWFTELGLEIIRVLRPGGYCLSFGGPRTAHRMIAGLEDAGFEVRDVMSWLFGCLSDDSEVLTEFGWMTYYQIRKTKNVRIFVYDPVTDSYRIELPERWNEYQIEDTCFRIQSDSTDQLVTGNHRCLVEREGTLVFKTAAELAWQHEASIPVLEGLQSLLKAISDTNKGTSSEEQDMLKKMPLYVEATQGENSNGEPQLLADHLFGMRNECLETECLVEKNKNSCVQQNVQWCKSYKNAGAILQQGEIWMEPGAGTGFKNPNDWASKSIMERRDYLSNEEGLLCQGVNQIRPVSPGIHIDGQGRRICDRIPSCNGQRIGQAATENGSCSSYRSQPDEQQNPESDAIRQQQGSQNVRMGTSYRTTMATFTAVNYSGLVFCPTVSTGAFVARRNGKIFLTGNSGFPKSHNLREHGVGTALKPGYEPIGMFRKPLDGTVEENFNKWGTGVLHIEKCRVPGEPWKFGSQANIKNGNFATGGLGGNGIIAENVIGGENGRWPANVMHDGSPEVLSLFPESKGQMADVKGTEPSLPTGTANTYSKMNRIGSRPKRDDSGSAARFFHQFQHDEEDLDFRRFIYEGKTSRSDRNEGVRGKSTHPTVKPTALMQHLVRLVTPEGGECLDPCTGSGSTGKACVLEHINFTGIDLEQQWIDIAHQRMIWAWNITPKIY